MLYELSNEFSAVDASEKKKNISFAVPMAWREHTDLESDCYLCFTKTKVISINQRDKIHYPNLSSTFRPVPHSQELHVPIPH